MQDAAALNERHPRQSGRNEPIAEAELAAQLDAIGLLDEQRVGPAIDRVPVNLLTQDHPTGAGASFQEHERLLPAMKLEGG